MSHNNSQDESHYVTLPSDGGGPQLNATNDYKVQMPFTFQCDGPGWEVGLSSLSLPVEDEVPYAMKFIFPSGTKLIRMDFPTKSHGITSGLVQRQTEDVMIDEALESKEVKDGASFVRCMVNLLQRKVGEILMKSNTVRDDWYNKTNSEQFMFHVKWTSPTSVLWDDRKTGKWDSKL